MKAFLHNLNYPVRLNRLLKGFWVVFTLVIPSLISAQNDISISDPVMGKAEVSAPGSITFKPGFQAVQGSNLHAYIGPAQTTTKAGSYTPISQSGTTKASASSDMNYIRSVTYREGRTTPADDMKHLEDIQYFDGLGRPVQTINVAASPNGKDIIQAIRYDEYGRESVNLLPFLDGSANGSYRSNVSTSNDPVNNFYNLKGSVVPEGKVADGKAFGDITYDNSPLNRIVSQTGAGSQWSDKPVNFHYLSNTEAKTGWNVSSTGTFTSFTYPVNSLFLNETVDEQGNTTREYKDKEGQVVLKESLLDGSWLSTAYIYDDFGLLRCVVPPKASDPNTDKDLCFYYTYDGKRRMTTKIVPGGGTFTMVYDNRDRLRCTQNSLQNADGEWSFTKYDALNRPVITGILKYSSVAAALETAINALPLNESTTTSNTYYGYDNLSFPNGTQTTEIQSVNYYDNYDFLNLTGVSDSLKNKHYNAGDYDISSIMDADPIGKITGSVTRVLSPAEDAAAIPKNMLYSAVYYDKYGRTLRTISENHLGGKDILSNKYEDITSLLLSSRQEHHKGAENITIDKYFEYDHTGRLLATRQQIGSSPAVTLNALKYNELGEVVNRFLYSKQTTGDRTFLQKVNYTYNIRGWLNSINDPSNLTTNNAIFGMQLFYENTAGMGTLSATGQYNGNIAGMKWNTRGDKMRGYSFTYDNLNRMRKASYADGSSLNEHAGYNNEEITSYDENGNIQGLVRSFENTTVDNLAYTYFAKTNQIQKITDSGTPRTDVDHYPGTSTDYAYDANGNMKTDGAKNIAIRYDKTLNLPQAVDFGANNRIFYHYTASGQKLVKRSGSSYIHYIGNIVYVNGNLSYIITDEGRTLPIGEGSTRTWAYEYDLKDHLGNTRATFLGSDLGGSIDISQTTSYYPFGLTMVQSNSNTDPNYTKNKYLYNGKEIQDDMYAGVKLDWYDYGKRFYDPQIGRWTTVDPLAEKARRWNPYAYCYDNPLRFIDPDGMEAGTPDDKKKQEPSKTENKNNTPTEIKYLPKLNTSGSPIKISGSLEGKFISGKIGFTHGTTQVKLDGSVGKATATADGKSLNITTTALSGNATIQFGKFNLNESVSAGKGSVNISEQGLNGSYSFGNLSAGLNYGDKSASAENSWFSSTGDGSNSYSAGQGNTNASTNSDETSVTVGVGPASGTIAIDHQNTSNFLTDVFNMIGGVINDYIKK